MATERGRLILLLASQDVQTAQQMATRSARSLVETTRQLQGLLTGGFILISGPETEPAVYRLAPRALQLAELAPDHRVLVVDDDITIRELVVAILEDEGYAVLAAAAPLAAIQLLEHVPFDVVITDGFSQTPAAVLTNAAAVLAAAGATPVALFSAHPLKLEAAQAAGFRTLIHKPFDVAALVAVVQQLQQHAV